METINIEIKMKKHGVMKAELYPEIAPITVKNFVELIENRFFDGLIFHRVISGFMIQGGGYDAKGMHHDAKSIKGEFASNGIKNDLKHTAGVLSMARTNDPNSASGQFFICSASCAHLDGSYAAFGKVTDELSLANVLDISHVQTTNIGYGFSDFPVEPIVIKTIVRNI